MIETLFIFLMSTFLLFFLSDYLVSALSHFSRKTKLSVFFLGVLVLALGTSLPELVDSIVSSFEGYGELGLGTLLGSSITNVCLVLSLSAIINPIKNLTQKELKDSIIVLLASILFIFLLVDGNLSRLDGFILIAFYLIYIYINHKKEVVKEDLILREIEVDLILLPLLILGIIFMGWVVVNSAVDLVNELNLSLAFFGFTILALSTSFPEISTSVFSSIKKKSKMAIGNVVGSNMVNLLLIGGIMALINPINFNFDILFAFSSILVILSSLILVLFSFTKRNITKKEGLALLFLYVFYLVASNYI